MPIRVECAPAFNYARSQHTTELVQDDSIPNAAQNKALFKSEHLTLDLRYVAENTTECVTLPNVNLQLLDLTKKGHLGPGVYADLNLMEGQAVTFVLRTPPAYAHPPRMAPTVRKAEELGVSLDSEFSI
jgi:hypothetical protein